MVRLASLRRVIALQKSPFSPSSLSGTLNSISFPNFRCSRSNSSNNNSHNPIRNKLRSPGVNDAKALLEAMSHRQGSVITNDKILQKYNMDWTQQYKGTSKILVKPQSTEELSSILSYCNQEKIGIVPQAGNTGVVGGSVPIRDEIILSVEALDDIYSFDEVNGILSCGAGCILQTLQEKVANEWDHLVPIDLGSKGSCMIGGNLSTNAGGQYYYRFGSIHANVLGLEVVLPDGTVLDLMNLNRKDNTGYDLKHLFIGAEGTLGVISKVALSCPRLPKSRNVAFLACDDFNAVQRTLSIAKGELGEILAAFEFMDKEILDVVKAEKSIPITKTNPAGEKENHRFCLLIETQGSSDEHDGEKMENFLEKCMSSGDVVDGVLAQDLKQVHEMWEIRESCNPIIKSRGYNYKYDISIPIPEYYAIVEEMRDRLSSRPDAIDVNWGHVIDGNLHFNVITPGNFEHDEELKCLLEPFIFEAVVSKGGSISAEHGLGQCKNNYLGTLAKNAEVLDVMKMMKNTFDPNGIMNPGKYLPNKEK